MFLDRLLNAGPAPLLEGMMQFTGRRHAVIAENIVNSSTPGYRQKDLSLPAFQKALAKGIEQRDRSGRGGVGSTATRLDDPKSGLLFHDRNNRSMETLMSDLSSNALKHNMYSEMLRKHFDKFETVLRDRL